MTFDWQDGNKLQLLINGEQFFPRVFDCIRSAKREILLETFIVFADKVGIELKDALLDAASRGVRIEVTVDGYGTANLDGDYIADLVHAGVHIRMFDPKPRFLGMRTNLFRRLHRKIVVVDGEVAFIGGINFSADHLMDYGPKAKQDYAVEVRGPIVNDIRKTGRDILRECAAIDDLPVIKPVTEHQGEVRIKLVVRDNARHRTDIEIQYIRALRNARDRVTLAHAYFLPSYRLLRELRNAARRGVEVTLILQGEPDMRWASMFSSLLYNYLLRHDVIIYEYCQRPLHGKVAVVDSDWATVGSSNLDPLSLSLNLEANLVISDPALNAQLHKHLNSLATDHCDRISLQLAVRGYWWRAPLIFICFHFLRHFPDLVGMLPAHTPKLELPAIDENIEPDDLQCSQEKF